jgi:hypothetical protein
VPSYRWHVSALLLAAAHHLDHVLRGSHVGWPVTADVNTFTYTLAIYPLIALGFLLRSARYWLTVAIGGIVMLSAVHVAIERPPEILGGYANPLAGLIAFGVLIALIVVLTVIAFRYAVVVGMLRR